MSAKPPVYVPVKKEAGERKPLPRPSKQSNVKDRPPTSTLGIHGSVSSVSTRRTSVPVTSTLGIHDSVSTRRTSVNYVSPKSTSHHYPPIPLELQVSEILARSLKVEWKPHPNTLKALSLLPADSPIPDEQKVRYQLSKSEGTSGIFKHVYEGEELSCAVSGLVPLTKYTLKLRTKWWAANETVEWSPDHTSIEVETTDESELAGAYLEIIRAIKDNRIVALQNTIKRVHAATIDFNTRDKAGLTLLMIACQNGSKEIVELLLNSGASTSLTTKSGKSPLSMAVTYGNLNAVEALIKFPGVDKNIKDRGGSTPLMWAAENAGINKHGMEILTLLTIKNEAGINIHDNQGRTAFDRLCGSDSGSIKAAQILLSCNCRTIQNVTPTQPMTSLMIAAMNGNKELVKLLIDQYPGNLNEKTAHGMTALQLAKGSNQTGVVEILEKIEKDNSAH